MRNPSNFEHELDEIRVQIYEETKDLTPVQRAERTRKIGEAAAKKYGFRIATNEEMRQELYRDVAKVSV